MSCLLSDLVALSSDELHQHTQGVNEKRAGAEWELAFCLLAIERNQTHAELNCSSVVSYAERFLELAPHKTMELLRIARSLEHLPLLSQARTNSFGRQGGRDGRKTGRWDGLMWAVFSTRLASSHGRTGSWL